MLQPKADDQETEIHYHDFLWIGPYVVEKVLLKNKYIVRKLDTNKTQILHRVRLQKFNPEIPTENKYQAAQWQIDDHCITTQDDL